MGELLVVVVTRAMRAGERDIEQLGLEGERAVCVVQSEPPTPRRAVQRLQLGRADADHLGREGPSDHVVRCLAAVCWKRASASVAARSARLTDAPSLCPTPEHPPHPAAPHNLPPLRARKHRRPRGDAAGPAV
eukprot:3889831-Rhodomonas_salina.1